MDKVQWDNVDREFKHLRKNKSFTKDNLQLRSKLLRKALTEGFFMNTARRIPNLKGTEGTYLTVHEGFTLKVDRASTFATWEIYPDWLIYTEASGGGSNMGQIKMGFEVKLKWVEAKMPRLKEVDADGLSGGKRVGEKRVKREDEEEEEKEGEQIMDREEKLRMLKERYAKRLKKKNM